MLKLSSSKNSKKTFYERKKNVSLQLPFSRRRFLYFSSQRQKRHAAALAAHWCTELFFFNFHIFFSSFFLLSDRHLFPVRFLSAKLCLPQEIYAFITIPKSSSTNVPQRNYSKTTDKIKPVKLAYASYESTDATHATDKTRYPVVIMHGLLGSKNNWNSLSKHIHSRTQHKIIAVDARNHGDSPHTPEFNYPSLAEDIHYLMSDLNISKIDAIGHSLGGRAMMLFALKYPQLVNSLIVVDISPIRTSPAILEMTQLFNAMLSVKLENGIPLSKARKVVNAQLAEVISDLYVRQFLLTNLVEVEGGSFKWRVNLEAIVNNFQSIVNFKTPSGKFKGPVLFIGGAKSTYLRPEDHKDILKFFPKSEFRYIEDAGHWVHTEKPTEFLNLVCDFLNNRA